jgi:hypothetical protein
MTFTPSYQGYEAFCEGELVTANPHDTGTIEAEEWEAGWLRAQAEEDDAVA